ncbi:hydrogenase iron-sulfur subunit [Candidatus Thorarchaeota archaeon]|nr:MAG: hydrogenase iron-sulfur subunit [Candidatus Thorarchaeota archaeon]
MNPSKKPSKKEIDSDKLAVFLCNCGSNVADAIDIESLRKKYESEGILLVDVDDHLCSEQGVSDLIAKVKKSKAKRVVIAGCSPHLHRELFAEAVKEAGIDPGHLHMANIREQCSWVHYDDPVVATRKAAAIIDTGIAQVRGSNPIPTFEFPIIKRAMIIGGGVAGITSALELADSGIETVIVEREGFLGGHMAKWDKLFPTFDCSICILGPMMTRLTRHPNVRIMTLAEVTEVRGNVGRYRVRVKQKPRYVDIESCTGCNRCLEVCPVEVADEYNMGLGKRKAMVRPSVDAVPIAPFIDTANCIGCQSCSGVCEPKSLRYDEVERIEVIDVGAVILATGFKPFNPTIVEEFGYGHNPDVITSIELERLINPEGPSGGKLVRPSNGAPPRNIVFVPCVGSRSHRLNRPYCSRVCCAGAVKEAIQVKQHLPDCNVYVFYTDMRVFGKGHEELYVRAAEEYKINFVRGTIGEVVHDPISDNISIRAEDTLVRRMLEFETDLVVLMIGMDAEPSNIQLSRMFKTPLDENGFFLEQHPKLSPSSTHSKGVFLAGVSQGPKDIADTVAHSGLAASKVKTLFTAGDIISEACVPTFDVDLCINCRLCEEVCTPNAIKFNEYNYPEIDMAACRGCGACAAACPSGALDLPCMSNEQLESATKAAVEFNPQKPAIVGYLCRWCAYTAADRAGTARMKYPPNMIPIQVPCTGRLNADTLLTAFAAGADGVAIMGCHVQDCHYRSGARYAKNRTDKMREILDVAGIDSRRLYFGSASASEADSFAEQVTQFVNDIVKIGPLGKKFPRNLVKKQSSEEVTGR